MSYGRSLFVRILCHNQCLWPEVFVNSSALPYNMVVANQKQNEIARAQNLMHSPNDDMWKNHIDNGGRPAATTIDHDEQSKINQVVALPKLMGCI